MPKSDYRTELPSLKTVFCEAYGAGVCKDFRSHRHVNRFDLCKSAFGNGSRLYLFHVGGALHLSQPRLCRMVEAVYA